MRKRTVALLIVLCLVVAAAGALRLRDGGAETTVTADGTTVALLPEHLIDNDVIGAMQVGESGWTTPWVMAVFEDRTCWLTKKSLVAAERGGTVQLLVERTERGFVVTVPRDYTYRLSDSTPWYGPGASNLVPVIEVKTGDWSF